MKTREIFKLVVRSRTVQGPNTVDGADIIVPQDCWLEWIDFAGGMAADGAAGGQSGEIYVGRGGRATLQDDDNGKMLASTGGYLRREATGTDNGLSFSKFCPVSIPLRSSEILVVTWQCATATIFGIVTIAFSR